MYVHDEEQGKGILGIFATFQHHQVRVEVVTNVTEVS